MELIKSVPSSQLLAIAFAFIVICSLISKWTYKRLPPGPWGLPFFGYQPFLGKHPQVSLSRLADVYGPVFRIRLGRRMVVVLNDLQAIKQAYVDDGETFSGRAEMLAVQYITDGMGLTATEGALHKEHRRFTVSTLKELRYTKMQELITDEAKCLVQKFRDRQGAAWDPSETIQHTASNVICGAAFSKRFDYSDATFHHLVNNMRHVANALSSAGPLTVPWLRYVPPWRAQWKIFCASLEDARQFINTKVESHYETYAAMSAAEASSVPVGDYIDAFASHRRKQTNQTKSTFTRDQLRHSLFNLFNGGTETATVTFRWALLLLIHHPDVQRRVQRELDDTVGRNRYVELDDRVRLPYTKATIAEIQRCANIQPLGVIRRTLKATTLLGFYIPKGTWVIPNLWRLHRDEKYFPEPQRFKPERFLDDNGCMKSNPAFLPYGLGKRSCIGESLADTELFLLLTNLLHFLHIRADESSPLPRMDQFTTNISVRPLPFKICAVAREEGLSDIQ